MKASQCSLNYILSTAKNDAHLASVLSFIQVEYGLAELQGHWDGFVDASDFYGQTYSNKRDVANNFGEMLVEILELEESVA
jgi:hypothetical protein